jgi:hypothetical protein
MPGTAARRTATGTRRTTGTTTPAFDLPELRRWSGRFARRNRPLFPFRCRRRATDKSFPAGRPVLVASAKALDGLFEQEWRIARDLQCFKVECYGCDAEAIDLLRVRRMKQQRHFSTGRDNPFGEIARCALVRVPTRAKFAQAMPAGSGFSRKFTMAEGSGEAEAPWPC